jgi:hypothetical protein
MSGLMAPEETWTHERGAVLVAMVSQVIPTH